MANPPLPHPGPFLERLLAELDQLGVEVNGLHLDHLCYRVGTTERYMQLRNELCADGELLAETMLGGRPIATFRLHVPIVHDGRSIHLVELPAPKPGSPYAEGWEHAEFVVDEDLLSFTQRYQQVKWDLSDLDKPVNADVRLRLGDISVKFHRMALDEVIRREQAEGKA
jgi:predicted metalloenzyme YecM